MEQVCSHFKTGFCKFGEFCRKHHVKVICSKEKCNGKDCTERHPKTCKYFKTNQVCKFGMSCSYLHVTLKEGGEIFQLTSKVNDLESLINSMSQKIDNLTKELEVVKTKKETNANEMSSEQTIKCDLCEYTASTSTVLKRHVTINHKKNAQLVVKTPCNTTPALEQERSIALNDSLQLELPVQERENETLINSPPKATEHIPPVSLFKCDLCSFEGTHSFALEAHLSLIHNEIIYKTSSSVNFKCDICKHESKSLVALNGHISLKHNMHIPHTGSWEDNKCHICNNNFNNTCHFKNHLIEQHGFSDESIECMNCESTEVGLYRAMPFQSVCMNCKNCELLEANM